MVEFATITIEVLSKRSGVDLETILNYQREGFIRKPTRVPGNLTFYRIEDLDRLEFVRRALSLGFTAGANRALAKLHDGKSKSNRRSRRGRRRLPAVVAEMFRRTETCCHLHHP